MMRSSRRRHASTGLKLDSSWKYYEQRNAGHVSSSIKSQMNIKFRDSVSKFANPRGLTSPKAFNSLVLKTIEHVLIFKSTKRDIRESYSHRKPQLFTVERFNNLFRLRSTIFNHRNTVLASRRVMSAFQYGYDKILVMFGHDDTKQIAA